MAAIRPGKQMNTLAKVAVVGSGLMGHGIAQVFAVAGHNVTVIDPNRTSLEAVPTRIRENLTTMVEHGVPLADDVDTIVERVALSTDLAEGCRSAAFVTEAVYEDMALKQEVFTQLDAICPPDVVLCSNTSVMSITEIASKAKHRQRIVGTHWWNPPYLIPLVEVVRTEETAVSIAESIFTLLQQIGKRPVHVYRDVPGFVGNRLQHALWREAFAIIDEGICDPATVDEVVRNSFGLRLPVLAPVENADMVGLDLTLAIHQYILPHINAQPTPSATLQQKAEQGALGFKSGNGFLNWSQEDIDASRKKLTTYLLDVLVKGNSENNHG